MEGVFPRDWGVFMNHVHIPNIPKILVGVTKMHKRSGVLLMVIASMSHAAQFQVDAMSFFVVGKQIRGKQHASSIQLLNPKLMFIFRFRHLL